MKHPRQLCIGPLAAVGLAILLLPGCASSSARNGDDAASEPVRSHDGLPWPKVAPAALLPDRAVRGRFEVTQRGETRVAPFTLAPVEGDAWVLEIEGLQKARWELHADRSLRLPWQISYDEAVRVEYEPALVLLPPAGGGRTVTRAEMRVYRLEDGGLKTAGSCRYVVTPAGPGDFESSPDAPVACYARSVREIDVPLANATVKTLSAYAAGEGPVRSLVERTVRPLGLFPTTMRTDLRRLDVEPASPTASEPGSTEASDAAAAQPTARTARSPENPSGSAAAPR